MSCDSTVLSIQQHSHQGLTTLCHLAGCLTFCIIYILLIVIFYSIRRKRMSVYLYWTLAEVSWNQFSSWAGPHFTQHYQWAPRLFMRGLTHWSQETLSGHGHLHPDMPQTPTSPCLLSACQKRKGSISEHSGITYIEILQGEKTLRFILVEKRRKQKELTG